MMVIFLMVMAAVVFVGLNITGSVSITRDACIFLIQPIRSISKISAEMENLNNPLENNAMMETNLTETAAT